MQQVEVVDVKWWGGDAVELTFKDQTGRVAYQILYRDREAEPEVVAQGCPWSFAGDGSLVEQWQAELHIKFQLPFDIMTREGIQAARTGN